ncbi:unnamed protein product [Camellia sinensis]
MLCLVRGFGKRFKNGKGKERTLLQHTLQDLLGFIYWKRMESVAITEWSGVAKVLGTMLCVGGAMVYSFVKGPPVYPQATQDQNSQSYTGCGTKAQCLKGSLFALSAQATWSLWLIMQKINQAWRAIT